MVQIYSHSGCVKNRALLAAKSSSVAIKCHLAVYLVIQLYKQSLAVFIWRSEGIITNLALKDACSVSLIATILSLMGSSLHLHLIWLEISLYKKSKSFSIHHFCSLFGLDYIRLYFTSFRSSRRYAS